MRSCRQGFKKRSAISNCPQFETLAGLLVSANTIKNKNTKPAPSFLFFTISKYHKSYSQRDQQSSYKRGKKTKAEEAKKQKQFKNQSNSTGMRISSIFKNFFFHIYDL